MPLALLLLFGSANAWAAPRFLLPEKGIGPTELAVIVNDADPLSARIGIYYAEARRIPPENVIHVSFPPGEVLSRDLFQRLKAEVDARTPEWVQAYALTWAAPYRVDCMSITTAFAAGFDEAYCSRGCAATRPSPYFNSRSRRPHAELKLRPTMALAGSDFEAVKALIDRGVASDRTYPKGTGYLLSTSDRSRNVRAGTFPALARRAAGRLRLEVLEQDVLRGKDDVLFYFTGLATVPDLETNRFLPGAVADHLTSSGGALTGSRQMSSLRWLEAGATGSYGAVAEPCNYPEKFPDPAVVIGRYYTGEPLIEAYWKSVAWPGQGIFIGEPLANPFGGHTVSVEGDRVTLRTHALEPGRYELQAADSPVGPYATVLRSVSVRWGANELRFRHLDRPFYRLVRMP